MEQGTIQYSVMANMGKVSKKEVDIFLFVDSLIHFIVHLKLIYHYTILYITHVYMYIILYTLTIFQGKCLKSDDQLYVQVLEMKINK